jgi:hypothetical protein
MSTTQFRALTLLLLSSALPALAPAASQDTVEGTQFAAPTRLMAGEEYLGKGRMYASPAVYDMNADGRPDIVIADLVGRPSVALASADGPMSFGPEKPVLNKEEEQLDFNNW